MAAGRMAGGRRGFWWRVCGFGGRCDSCIGKGGLVKRDMLRDKNTARGGIKVAIDFVIGGETKVNTG
jgi:hypothetical protein